LEVTIRFHFFYFKEVQMRTRTLWIAVAVVVLATLACGPTTTPTPTAAPGALDTAVAQTVEAKLTEQSASAAPTDTPTSAIPTDAPTVTQPAPDAPSPTEAPTEAPTAAPTRAPTVAPAVPTATRTPTPPTAAPTPCAMSIDPALAPYLEKYARLVEAIGCPLNEPQQIWSAEERFQGGRMIWRGDNSTIYILYSPAQTYQIAADQFVEGDPEDACPEVGDPPAGLVKPVRGFNWQWCHTSGVRDRLGWALETETGYSATWQRFDRATVVWGTGGTLFVFYHNGMWEPVRLD
jgi:hypothetical protein